MVTAVRPPHHRPLAAPLLAAVALVVAAPLLAAVAASAASAARAVAAGRELWLWWTVAGGQVDTGPRAP